MIDVESQVYTPVAEALRAAFPGINVTGVYVNAPSAFPHVSMVEQDNYTTPEHMDTSEQEKFATVMYQVDVYSDNGTKKKSECRAIMKVIDDFMYRHNFTRLSQAPVPNLENASIYRLTARYRAVTDGENLYRR